jgi:ubiquinone/menaquinone biosynthesis C-methylase UbiE
MKYQDDFWRKYFRYYDVLLKVIPYQELLKTIATNLKISSNNKILDLGSGTGNLNYFLPEGSNVSSLDNSQEALNQLQTKFPTAKTHTHSIVEPLPFKDSSFDRLASNNVLYILPKESWYNVIKEIKRVVKPNGIIVISNLNKNFSPKKIYFDHIRKSISTKGKRDTIKTLLHLIYPTIQIFRYNKVISKNNAQENYFFVDKNDQIKMFAENNIVTTTPTKSVYLDQAFLDVFVNKK